MELQKLQKRTKELQATFEKQKEMGLLDELTLYLVCEWIAKFWKSQVKIVTVQAFGMIQNRPDQWNVKNYQKYLQEIAYSLVNNYTQNELPIILLITGPGGANDPIGIAGQEAVETVLELEKMLGEDFEDKCLILPVGQKPVDQEMANDGLDYVRNLETAKQIIGQIAKRMDLPLNIDEFWTDSVRCWKHIACLICLGLDFGKVKTTERIEVDENGEMSKNQNTWIQTGSIGIILYLLFQRFLQTKLKSR